MAAVEATIITTAMPGIAGSLGGFGLFAWVFSAYMLMQAVTIPLYGRLADIYGRRRMFFVGVSAFLIGSTLCGLSRSMLQLVLYRAIQGLGAGGVQPIANTIVGDIYSPVERARVQGMLSGVFGISALIGPSLGAAVVQYGAWPFVFWVNLPIGVAAIVMIALFLPRHETIRPRLIDYQGSLLLIVVTSAFMLLLTSKNELSQLMQGAVSLVCFLAGSALVVHERRIAEPMLPLELWRNRVIVSGSVGSLVTGALMMGVTAYLPTYIEGVMGCDARVSAAILASMSVVWVIGSTTAGLYLPHTAYRRIATLGALGLICGAVMLIAMTPNSGPGWAAFGAMLIGVGMGFCNTTYMVSVQTSVGWRQRGAATSSTMFLRFLGQSFGAALFNAVLNANLVSGGTEATSKLGQLLNLHERLLMSTRDLAHLIPVIAAAMRYGYLLTAILALVALLLALTYPARLGPSSQVHQN